MKQRIFITCLFLSSFFGYLSLFGSGGVFICQMEQYVIEEFARKSTLGVRLCVNPFTSLSTFEFVPVIGQALLVTALLLSFVKKAVACKIVSIVATLFLFIPFGMILYIGFEEGNIKMIASAIPFFSFSGLLLWSFKKKK